MMYVVVFLAMAAMIVAVMALIIQWLASLGSGGGHNPEAVRWRSTMLTACIIILGVGVAMVTLFRYSIVATGDAGATAYRLDRWTGQMHVIDRGGRMRPVTPQLEQQQSTQPGSKFDPSTARPVQ